MRIGMVGLGRMGGDLSRRLMADGHEVVVNDLDEAAIADLADEGAIGAHTLADLAGALESPRVVWVMVPAAVTGAVVDAVAAVLDTDDIVIDGGNSNWNDDLARSAALGERGIHYVDIGTSGGVHGLERGYCLMVGGDDAAVATLEPILDTIAPGIDAAPRTPGRTGDPVAAEKGWLHCGPSGAGHFVKMIHNGIEYGMMAAIAEGLNLLDRADLGSEDREADAETAPMRSPEAYRYDFDLGAITEVWRRGSVIGSWLLDLTAGSLAQDPALDAYEGHVSDSGEGRWTAQAAIDLGVPATVLTGAVYQRFSSRDNDEMAGKVLSAMRHAFGGHLEKAADE
ncbi:MAG: phosphogluconate dehydrogenase (NAD(+)-dependent, decarboxylating) [Actinomycetota bacterium]